MSEEWAHRFALYLVLSVAILGSVFGLLVALYLRVWVRALTGTTRGYREEEVGK